MEGNLKDFYLEALKQGAGAAEPKEAAKQPYAVVPQGWTVLQFNPEMHADIPSRKRASVKFSESASFAEYVKVFGGPGTRIFCERTVAKFEAVIDYHLAAEGGQRWGCHRAHLELRRTPEWQAWLKMDKQKFGQLQFAEFLEDQTPWIVRPEAANLLEIALNLEQTSKTQFKSTARLQDGARTFHFEDERNTPTQVRIPESFELALAPFDGSMRHVVKARLRYRVQDGALIFFYVLINPELVEREAVETAIGTIQTHTGLDVLIGTLQSMGANP